MPPRRQPLAPGAQLRRTTRLQPGKPLDRARPLPAGTGRPPAKRPAGTGPSVTVKLATFARDGQQCVPGITCGNEGGPLVWHHRCNRGMGGSKAPWINGYGNGLTACARCNDALDHDAVDASWYEAGWKVKHGTRVPGDVPVRYPDGTWWLLTDDGRREQVAA